MPIIELKEAEFNDFIKNADVTIIDFCTDWCKPCHRQHDEFLKLDKLLKNPVQVGQVDCEANGKLAEALNVFIYPTVMIYKDNKRIIFPAPQDMLDEAKEEEEQAKKEEEEAKSKGTEYVKRLGVASFILTEDDGSKWIDRWIGTRPAEFYQMIVEAMREEKVCKECTECKESASSQASEPEKQTPVVPDKKAGKKKKK